MVVLRKRGRSKVGKNILHMAFGIDQWVRNRERKPERLRMGKKAWKTAIYFKKGKRNKETDNDK